MVYKLRNNQRYFWSKKPLELSHFRIKKNIESDTTATVYPSIVGEISKVFNYPPVILFTSDDIGRSWIDTSQFGNSEEDRKLLNQLLEHEKKHFDLMEIYVRLAEDSLKKNFLKSYQEKYDVIRHYYKIADSVQKVFDFETGNGTNEKGIDKWNNTINSKIN